MHKVVSMPAYKTHLLYWSPNLTIEDQLRVIKCILMKICNFSIVLKSSHFSRANQFKEVIFHYFLRLERML